MALEHTFSCLLIIFFMSKIFMLYVEDSQELRYLKVNENLLLVCGERRRETRRFASRRSTEGASCYGHMGKLNKEVPQSVER